MMLLSRIQRIWPFPQQQRRSTYHHRRSNPFQTYMAVTNNNNYFSNTTIASSTQLQQSKGAGDDTSAETTTMTEEQQDLLQRVQELQDENEQLTNSIEKLSTSVEKLTSDNAQLVDVIASSTQIVLEKFEGEDGEPEWCDELQESGACPVEPQISFGQAFRDRAVWLVGLLLLQSFSGIILSRNEALIADHPFIVYFLTMLVGAGGNAGNQASVRVIRGLALGTLNARTQGQFLAREFKMAMSLSSLLTLAGFLRAAAFSTPFPEAIAITTALFLIVFSSICLGAVLPLGLKKIGVDPAHSSTSIQVIMDILGVILAVGVSSILLDSPLGVAIMSKMTGGG